MWRASLNMMKDIILLQWVMNLYFKLSYKSTPGSICLYHSAFVCYSFCYHTFFTIHTAYLPLIRNHLLISDFDLLGAILGTNPPHITVIPPRFTSLLEPSASISALSTQTNYPHKLITLNDSTTFSTSHDA